MPPSARAGSINCSALWPATGRRTADTPPLALCAAAPTAHELPRFWCVEGAEALAAEAPGHLLDDAGFSEWLCGRRPLDGEARAAGPAPGAGADEA